MRLCLRRKGIAIRVDLLPGELFIWVECCPRLAHHFSLFLKGYAGSGEACRAKRGPWSKLLFCLKLLKLCRNPDAEQEFASAIAKQTYSCTLVDKADSKIGRASCRERV